MHLTTNKSLSLKKMEIGWVGSRSVFGVPRMDHRSVASERDTMRIICTEYGIPLFYYEAAMGLWSRVKGEYECESFVHGPARFLFMCLCLAVKWAGPAALTFEICRLQSLRKYFPYVTGRQWQFEEIRMCMLLDWDFF